MGTSRLAICLLLLGVQMCLSNPVTQKKSKIMFPNLGCPHYQLGETTYSKHVVALNDALTFLVNPTHSQIYMDIVGYPDTVYQAVINSSSLRLQRCSSVQSICTILDDQTSKSSNLLNVNQWNTVNVSIEESSLIISVNGIQTVKGSLLSIESDTPSKSKGGEVEVFVHPDLSVFLHSLPTSGYTVYVNLLCNETYTPEIEEITMAPPVTAVTKTLQDPFPNCPVHEVTQTTSLGEGLKLQDKLVVAVLPTIASLQMNVSFEKKLYKTTIDGSRTEVLQCSQDGTHCDMVDAGGIKGSDHLMANKWNYMTVSLTGGMVKVQVNSQFDLMGKAMSIDPDAEYATVDILAAGKTSGDMDNTIRVNVYCDDTEATTTNIFTDIKTTTTNIFTDTEETTNNIHFTAAPIGETTDAPDDTNDNSHVLKVISIILAVIIAILVIALVYYCYRTKCKKDGSQSSYQLHEEPQQQQQ